VFTGGRLFKFLNRVRYEGSCGAAAYCYDTPKNPNRGTPSGKSNGYNLEPSTTIWIQICIDGTDACRSRKRSAKCV
jgi:hypothetical protein